MLLHLSAAAASLSNLGSSLHAYLFKAGREGRGKRATVLEELGLAVGSTISIEELVALLPEALADQDKGARWGWRGGGGGLSGHQHQLCS